MSSFINLSVTPGRISSSWRRLIRTSSRAEVLTKQIIIQHQKDSFKFKKTNLHNLGIYAASSSLTKLAPRRHRAMLISRQIQSALEMLALACLVLARLAVREELDLMADPVERDHCCTRLLQLQLPLREPAE